MPNGVEISAPPPPMMSLRHPTGSLMGGTKRAGMAHFVDMYVAGDYSLRALVSHRLTLEAINRGFDMMKSGEATRSVILYDRQP